MTRLALISLVLTGLFASASVAASPQPTWTAKGYVTSLNAHTIAVNGSKCRITTASPARSTIRLYYIGAGAKIACADGVLRKIDVLEALPTLISSKPVSGGGSSLQASATSNGGVILSISTSSSSTTQSTVVSMSGAFGGFSVTAIGNGSITGGRPGSSLSLTCTLGDGSPDVGGLQVGDALTRMQCRNGVLTSITRAA